VLRLLAIKEAAARDRFHNRAKASVAREAKTPHLPKDHEVGIIRGVLQTRLSLVWLVLLAAVCGCAAPQRPPATLPADDPRMVTLNVTLKSAQLRFDLFLPQNDSPVPLVIVAHGWLRDRTRMSGWGRRLAEEGFVVAVPDLPTFSDHPRNARAINELIAWLRTDRSTSSRIDPSRIGAVGFSSGGLSTLLAAADNPQIRIWVGIDPVELRGLGVAAAPRFHAKAVVVRAPPSSWNHDGNALHLEQALPGGATDFVVPDAVHIDPEWPTDWRMEILMGKADEARREQFVRHAVDALRTELMPGQRDVENASRGK
jgi:acetyl esterase/lipase